MKLQIMSDLHFEMHADGGAELIRELDQTGVDVLVLAGDITMARHYEDLRACSSRSRGNIAAPAPRLVTTSTTNRRPVRSLATWRS